MGRPYCPGAKDCATQCGRSPRLTSPASSKVMLARRVQQAIQRQHQRRPPAHPSPQAEFLVMRRHVGRRQRQPVADQNRHHGVRGGEKHLQQFRRLPVLVCGLRKMVSSTPRKG